MTRTPASATAYRSVNTPPPTLQTLLSNSEDEFYGRLQHIWNNIVQLEDMGLIKTEEDKFIYAYGFAEAELQRACAHEPSTVTPA